MVVPISEGGSVISILLLICRQAQILNFMVHYLHKYTEEIIIHFTFYVPVTHLQKQSQVHAALLE